MDKKELNKSLHRLDDLSAQLNSTKRALSYLSSNLADLTEKSIEGIINDNEQWALPITYTTTQDIAEMLLDYITKLEEQADGFQSITTQLFELSAAL